MPNDSDVSQPVQEPPVEAQTPVQTPEQTPPPADPVQPPQLNPQVPVVTGDGGTENQAVVSSPETEAATAEEVPDQTFSWTAKEFVHHEKSFGWYVLFAGVAVVLSVLVYLLTKDIVSIVVIIIGAVVLLYYGAKAPGDITYTLSSSGVTIGQRYYDYENFRSFSVLQEGTARNIVFMPQKRFAFLVSIYYQPADEEMIMALLSTVLPQTEFSHDAIDRLMHKIRF